MDVSQFINERNTALVSFDKEKIIGYMKKYNVPIPSTEKGFWGGVAKAILALKDTPEEAKERSRCILKEYGMSENIF